MIVYQNILEKATKALKVGFGEGKKTYTRVTFFPDSGFLCEQKPSACELLFGKDKK